MSSVSTCLSTLQMYPHALTIQFANQSIFVSLSIKKILKGKNTRPVYINPVQRPAYRSILPVHRRERIGAGYAHLPPAYAPAEMRPWRAADRGSHHQPLKYTKKNTTAARPVERVG
ncbi:hypothetical protein L210DRAFT_374655 [Boletus edulis BED1]|uniref:Uncharacterized protein n=1 Tax=Boletus edulis BED1 TaxID=1328754 RepID=A0AAD4BQR7_BOLED|nr:hypothetical protein L210DRAFT_374655 [Boletus edulis BED1]